MNYYMKSVCIWRFSGPCFAVFGLNTDQKHSKYGHFSRSSHTFHDMYHLVTRRLILVTFFIKVKGLVLKKACTFAPATEGWQRL